MNKLFTIMLGLTLTITALSCKKEAEIVKPDESGGVVTPGQPDAPATGAVTPVGNPVGQIVTATIGPAGGHIESEDNRIRVDIPAGALAATQPVSVQPLDSNYCPGGTGVAFRLLPHGLTFAKPATITFQYDDEDVSGTAPELLRIAYQTNKGSWKSPAPKSLDTTAHTMTVETSHFSDWTFFKAYSLTAGSQSVAPGQVTHLQVSCAMSGKSATDEADLSLAEPIDVKYIKEWTVSAGGGELSPVGATMRQYKAPAKIPASNPVAVTVSLNIPPLNINGHSITDVRLVEHIYVAPEGISVSIDGGEWITYPGGANLKNAQKGLLGNLGGDYVSVVWKGGNTGTYRWTLNGDRGFILLRGDKQYQHIYEVNKKPVLSDGLLTVEQSRGGVVLGTFTATPAGWINRSPSANPIGRATVKGVFRLPNVVR